MPGSITPNPRGRVTRALALRRCDRAGRFWTHYPGECS